MVIASPQAVSLFRYQLFLNAKDSPWFEQLFYLYMKMSDQRKIRLTIHEDMIP